MKRHWLGCLLLVAAAPVGVLAVPENGDTGSAMLGYSAQSAAVQVEWEKKFRDGVSPDNIRENMRRLSARPRNSSPVANVSACRPAAAISASNDSRIAMSSSTTYTTGCVWAGVEGLRAETSPTCDSISIPLGHKYSAPG